MYITKNNNMIPRTFNGMMDNLFQNGWNLFNDNMTIGSVPVNIHETEKSYELQLVAPGLKKEDIKINVDGNILTMSYEHKEENKDAKEGKWLRNEYHFRSFKKSFTLTESIDSNTINAKYTDGILYVVLPKKEPVVKTQQISVN